MGELPDSTSEDETHLKEEHDKIVTLCDQLLELNDTWYVYTGIDLNYFNNLK